MLYSHFEGIQIKYSKPYFLREKHFIDPQVPLHAVTNTSSVDKDRICAAFS